MIAAPPHHLGEGFFVGLLVELKPEDFVVTEQYIRDEIPEGVEWVKELIQKLIETVEQDETTRDVLVAPDVALRVVLDMKPVHVYSLCSILLNQRIAWSLGAV